MPATPATLPAMKAGELAARDTVPFFPSQAGFTATRQMFRRMCSDNTAIVRRGVISVEKVTLLSPPEENRTYSHSFYLVGPLGPDRWA